MKMKKNKLLLPLLLVGSLIGLTGCSLFDDADIAIHNEYNPMPETPPEDPDAVVAGGVKASTNEKTPNALCFKNICYAKDDKINNSYKATEFNVNNDEDYYGNRSSNNYDLYVPNGLDTNAKQTVLLFIHGGAWVSGFKTDVNSYVQDFANRGYITATIKYTLLRKEMDDPTRSIFRNLDEINDCIVSIKEVLGELEFDTSKISLVIGGASSGAHLAMLYAYSRNATSALPIKFIVDAVGPVDIKPDNWKSFIDDSDTVLNGGLSWDAISSQPGNLGTLNMAGMGVNWNEYQTMRIANGMCGLPHTNDEVAASTTNETTITNPNAASTLMTKADGGEDQLSVTYWIEKSANKLPIICAYAGRDSIVGIAQYAQLDKVLTNNGITQEAGKRAYYYFKNSDHQQITPAADETTYNAFVGKIAEWLAATL